MGRCCGRAVFSIFGSLRYKALPVGLILRLGFGLRLRDVLTRVTVTESNLTWDGQRVGCTSKTTATPSAFPTSGSAAAQ
jgi:hypothetical protein